MAPPLAGPSPLWNPFMTARPSAGLLEVLERARRLGVLGPGPVIDHVEHARLYLKALADLPSGSLVADLGSGAGVPGLVIADLRPDLRLVLIDATEKRVALLEEALQGLGWSDRVRTLLGRAEDLGRQLDWRASFDAVVARLFGPPAVAAECGSPLLRPGGRLVVSEPPDGGDRWPADGLAVLKLVSADEQVEGLEVLLQETRCPDQFPRRVGIPAKRPLF